MKLFSCGKLFDPEPYFTESEPGTSTELHIY
jgi:hypothetical protein